MPISSILGFHQSSLRYRTPFGKDKKILSYNQPSNTSTLFGLPSGQNRRKSSLTKTHSSRPILPTGLFDIIFFWRSKSKSKT